MAIAFVPIAFEPTPAANEFLPDTILFAPTAVPLSPVTRLPEPKAWAVSATTRLVLPTAVDLSPMTPLSCRRRWSHRRSCMDAPVRARCFRAAWSRDRVRSCIRPFYAACRDRWPVWRFADLAQFTPASLMLCGWHCFSRPGSDRSFVLTLRRPPHTPDSPLTPPFDPAIRMARPREPGNPVLSSTSPK